MIEASTYVVALVRRSMRLLVLCLLVLTLGLPMWSGVWRCMDGTPCVVDLHGVYSCADSCSEVFQKTSGCCTSEQVARCAHRVSAPNPTVPLLYQRAGNNDAHCYFDMGSTPTAIVGSSQPAVNLDAHECLFLSGECTEMICGPSVAYKIANIACWQQAFWPTTARSPPIV